MTSPLVYEVRKKLLAGQALTLARLLWQSSYYHEPYSEGLRALSFTRGAQDASNRSEEYRYLLFNHEAVIVIAEALLTIWKGYLLIKFWYLRGKALTLLCIMAE